MTDQPPERAPLTIKRDVAVAGGACCPACGGLLAEGVRVCPRCGHNLDRPQQRAQRSRRRAGGLWASLSALFFGLARFVFLLVLVALVAVAGTLAYQRWWPAPAAPVPCATCRGDGRVTCPACGGAGQVDGAVINIPCSSCKGSGVFQQKLSKGTRPCPFCQGSGSKGTRTERTACATCTGRGVVTCPACEGRGRARPEP